jgi:hypothetical protein
VITLGVQRVGGDDRTGDLDAVQQGGEQGVISFVRSDRECSPVWTASGGLESISMFVRSDRGRRHRTLAATRGRVLAQVIGFRPWSGPVRSELTNIGLADPGVRSLVTNNCGQD